LLPRTYTPPPTRHSTPSPAKFITLRLTCAPSLGGRQCSATNSQGDPARVIGSRSRRLSLPRESITSTTTTRTTNNPTRCQSSSCLYCFPESHYTRLCDAVTATVCQVLLLHRPSLTNRLPTSARARQLCSRSRRPPAAIRSCAPSPTRTPRILTLWTYDPLPTSFLLRPRRSHPTSADITYISDIHYETARETH
jgi:hypothetical protein